jgi:phage terminase small subunit
MNDRQRKFAQLVVKGSAAGRAYEKAGYDARGVKADQSASRMLSTNEKVKAYIDELRAKGAAKTMLTLEKTHEILERIATKNIDKDPRVAVQALDQANKLRGSYAPDKHEVASTIEVVIGSGS